MQNPIPAPQKKRHRPSLEELVDNLRQKKATINKELDEQIKEARRKLAAKKRRERTHYLVQLGAILQQHLGNEPVDLKKFTSFLNALDTPVDAQTPRIRLFYDKNLRPPVVENGKKTGKVYINRHFSTFQECYTSFLAGEWFDPDAHPSKKSQK